MSGAMPDSSSLRPGTLSLTEAALLAVLAPTVGMSWWLLLLVQLGRLNLAWVGAGAAGLAVGLAVVARRGLGMTVKLRAPDLLAAAIVALALATRPGAPWPVFLDSGWYLNTGTQMARDGGLRLRHPAFEALGPDGRRLFVRSFSQLRQELPHVPDTAQLGLFSVCFAVTPDHSVWPYHPPLFTTWVALLTLVGGPGFGARAVTLFAVLATLGLAGLGARAFGPSVGGLAAGLASLSVIGVYYAQTPFAELGLGGLVLGGGYCLARATARDAPGRSNYLALAGLAWGLAPLTKIEGLLVMPIAVVLSWQWLRASVEQRLALRQAALFWAGLLAGVMQLAWLGMSQLRPYATLNGYGVLDRLAPAGPHLAVALLLAAATALLSLTLTRRLRPVALAAAPWRALVSGLIVLGGLALSLQDGRAVGEGRHPIGPAGFLTPIGLWLGVLGLVLVVLDERPLDRLRAGRGVLLAMSAVALPLPLIAPMITQTISPVYSVRRQVPLVLPLLLLFAAHALVGDHWVRRRLPLTTRGVAAIRVSLGLVLVAGLLAVGRPLRGWRDMAGAGQVVRSIAQAAGPDDILLFENPSGSNSAHFAAPTWTLGQRLALSFPGGLPPAARLEPLLEAWRAEGRRVYLVTDRRPGSTPLRSFELRQVGRHDWIGLTLASEAALPPATQYIEVALYVYEIEPAAPP
jgi:hypothetical protein